MELLDVREYGSEGQDLLPIETHFDEDGFTQTRVDQSINVLSFEIVLFNAPKFVSSQSNGSQIRQLMDDLEVLVPTIQLVLVEVQIHGAGDKISNLTMGSHVRNTHTFESDVATVRDISSPVVCLFEADHLNLDSLVSYCSHKLLSLENLAINFFLFLCLHAIGFVSLHDGILKGEPTDLDLSISDK